MNTTGLTIAKILVKGQGKPDAVLEFRPGLNVVAGASNTGKTYAWQLIDFLLGASRPPKTVPLGAGYSHAMIEIHPAAGSVFTIERALAGGNARAYSALVDDVTGDTTSEVLAEKHSAQNSCSISGRLLEYSGLAGKMIRQDRLGKKRSLSFRDVAWLALVDEERIIAERSPALSEQFILQTEKKSAFGLFLTGSDDSAIVTQEKPKDRKQRLELEMSILSGLLDDCEARLTTYEIDVDQLDGQRARLAAAIGEASGLVATRQSELDNAAATRDEVWSVIESLKSKRMFLTEQIKRLKLLDQHYASDRARLESALEAGEFFESLPGGECPVCGHAAANADESDASDQRLKEFQQACTAELRKITVLARELGTALTAMRNEDQGYARQQAGLQIRLEKANDAITGLLDRKVRIASEHLSQLIAQQARLSEAAYTANEVQDLRTRYSIAEQQSKTRTVKSKYAPKVSSSGTIEFCEVVEKTLRSWKFPIQGNVSWADTEFDLVIGRENRGSMGKGYRAVTHAAFTIALMRYCRLNALPHPGIVVIDSPLNPFKGADSDGEERVNTEVQEAFYEDLATDTSGDQVIIFENTEPSLPARAKMNYTHFSGNVANPRVGFFPASPSESTSLSE